MYRPVKGRTNVSGFFLKPYLFRDRLNAIFDLLLKGEVIYANVENSFNLCRERAGIFLY